MNKLARLEIDLEKIQDSSQNTQNESSNTFQIKQKREGEEPLLKPGLPN